MKVEVTEVAVPKPPVEVVIRLTESEARRLISSLYAAMRQDGSHPIGDDGNSLGWAIEDALSAAGR